MTGTFLSSVYIGTNDNGDTFRLTKSYAKNQKIKNRKRRCWNQKGDARNNNKQKHNWETHRVVIKNNLNIGIDTYIFL